jgi:hypothetical protein
LSQFLCRTSSGKSSRVLTWLTSNTKTIPLHTLPLPIKEVLRTFAPVFSRPVWLLAQFLILGTILACGKRTVTSALRAVGLSQETHFTNYHRVLNRSVWHCWFVAKVLLGLLAALLPPQAPLLVTINEIIERRKGAKIKTKGVFRDAVRSSPSKVVHCYGLRWVAMVLLVPIHVPNPSPAGLCANRRCLLPGTKPDHPRTGHRYRPVKDWKLMIWKRRV